MARKKRVGCIISLLIVINFFSWVCSSPFIVNSTYMLLFCNVLLSILFFILLSIKFIFHWKRNWGKLFERNIVIYLINCLNEIFYTFYILILLKKIAFCLPSIKILALSLCIERVSGEKVQSESVRRESEKSKIYNI